MATFNANLGKLLRCIINVIVRHHWVCHRNSCVNFEFNDKSLDTMKNDSE